MSNLGYEFSFSSTGWSVDSNVSKDSPRARARFRNQRTKKKVKEFLVKRRGYKRPDFNRMILDLCTRCGWTHEKIAFVLPVANASTVSEWARGGVPNYDNGDAFIELWKIETGIDIVPREGEGMTYKYNVGQLDIFDDGGLCDQVIEQLDEDIEPHGFNFRDLVMFTDGTPCLYEVNKNSTKGSLLVVKLGSKGFPFKPIGTDVRLATADEIEKYKEKQLAGEW